MDKVFIKSKFDRKLYSKFFYFNLFRKSASIYFFLLAAILSIYLAVKASQSPETTGINTTIYWVFSIILISTLPAFTFGRITATVNKFAKERATSIEIIEISKPKIVRFVEGVQGKTVLGWENFNSVYEYRDYVFMYIDRDRGLIFNKADITEGDMEIFRKLAMNNLAPGKKGKVRYFTKFKEEKNDKS
ncbi:MAG: YcxB family protein [Bacilli bacterium]|nr:YcxB family protein [Bacilli bacterium]